MKEKVDQIHEESTFDKFQSFLKRHWLLISTSTITSALAGLTIGLGLGFATGLPFFGLGAAITTPLFAGIGFILGLVVGASGALFRDQDNKPSDDNKNYIPVPQDDTIHENVNAENNNALDKPKAQEAPKLPLAELPSDLLRVTGYNLPTKDLSRMASVNKFFNNTLKPDLVLLQFLEAVAHGDQNQAERLLKNNLQLMTKQYRVTDYSKREFASISGFKYMLAALDTRYMRDMMLKCISEDETLTIKEKKGLVQELQSQYADFELNGVTYVLDGVTHENQKDFGIQPLIQALQDYENNFNQWSWATKDKQFCTKIGGAQRLVPAHVAQHYCEPGVPFYPKPSFMAETFNRCSKFYNYLNSSNHDWWVDGVNLVLGRDFGITRHAGGAADGGGRRWGRGAVPIDREALKTLFEIRTKDKEAIPQQLGSLLQELNQIEKSSVQPSFQKT